MQPAIPHILTVNGGSSSIKFALFAAGDSLTQILEGSIEGIGKPEATMQVKGLTAAESFSRPVTAPDHTMANQKMTDHKVAVDTLMDWLEERGGQDGLSAVGHRVVHGGPHYSAPERNASTMVEALRQLSPFDPQHLPEEIQLTEAFQRRFPDLPQVACFDTAFHHDLPRVARLLPIPRRYEAQGMRRYGFHGLSYAFLLGELARLAGPTAAQGRVILAHLGNGASLAAVHEGKSLDTSMSFTPTAGVPMSTRAGDLDPSLLWYLARTEQMSAQQFNTMVNFESGLLGISETSADMRDLLEHEAEDVRAAEAVALFCYQVKKWIGGFAAALGGLDTLVFAGGIGENAPVIRSRICAGLGFLGIELDETQNQTNAGVISTPTGTTQPIPSGSIGTALSCRPVTVRCCCTACCISPAMRCHSTKSNDSANGAGYAARIWFHRGQHLRTRYEVNRSETSEHLADDCRRQSDCAQAATRCG